MKKLAALALSGILVVTSIPVEAIQSIHVPVSRRSLPALSHVFNEQTLQAAVVFGALQPLRHDAIDGLEPVVNHILQARSESIHRVKGKWKLLGIPSLAWVEEAWGLAWLAMGAGPHEAWRQKVALYNGAVDFSRVLHPGYALVPMTTGFAVSAAAGLALLTRAYFTGTGFEWTAADVFYSFIGGATLLRVLADLLLYKYTPNHELKQARQMFEQRPVITQQQTSPSRVRELPQEHYTFRYGNPKMDRLIGQFDNAVSLYTRIPSVSRHEAILSLYPGLIAILEPNPITQTARLNEIETIRIANIKKHGRIDGRYVELTPSGSGAKMNETIQRDNWVNSHYYGTVDRTVELYRPDDAEWARILKAHLRIIVDDATRALLNKDMFALMHNLADLTEFLLAYPPDTQRIATAPEAIVQHSILFLRIPLSLRTLLTPQTPAGQGATLTSESPQRKPADPEFRIVPPKITQPGLDLEKMDGYLDSELKKAGMAVVQVDTLKDAMDQLVAERFEAVLVDAPAEDVENLQRYIDQMDPGLKIVHIKPGHLPPVTITALAKVIQQRQRLPPESFSMVTIRSMGLLFLVPLSFGTFWLIDLLGQRMKIISPDLTWRVPAALALIFSLVLYLREMIRYRHVIEQEREWQDTAKNHKVWDDGVKRLREELNIPETIEFEPLHMILPNRLEVIADLLVGNAPPLAKYIPSKPVVLKAGFMGPAESAYTAPKIRMLHSLMRDPVYARQAVLHELGEYAELTESGSIWNERKAGLGAWPRILINWPYYFFTSPARVESLRADKVAFTLRGLDSALNEFYRGPSKKRATEVEARLLTFLTLDGVKTNLEGFAEGQSAKIKDQGDFRDRLVAQTNRVLKRADPKTDVEEKGDISQRKPLGRPKAIRRSMTQNVANGLEVSISFESDDARWKSALVDTLKEARKALQQALDQKDTVALKDISTEMSDLLNVLVELQGKIDAEKSTPVQAAQPASSEPAAVSETLSIPAPPTPITLTVPSGQALTPDQIAHFFVTFPAIESRLIALRNRWRHVPQQTPTSSKKGIGIPTSAARIDTFFERYRKLHTIESRWRNRLGVTKAKHASQLSEFIPQFKEDLHKELDAQNWGISILGDTYQDMSAIIAQVQWLMMEGPGRMVEVNVKEWLERQLAILGSPYQINIRVEKGTPLIARVDEAAMFQAIYYLVTHVVIDNSILEASFKVKQVSGGLRLSLSSVTPHKDPVKPSIHLPLALNAIKRLTTDFTDHEPRSTVYYSMVLPQAPEAQVSSVPPVSNPENSQEPSSDSGMWTPFIPFYDRIAEVSPFTGYVLTPMIVEGFIVMLPYYSLAYYRLASREFSPVTSTAWIAGMFFIMELLHTNPPFSAKRTATLFILAAAQLGIWAAYPQGPGALLALPHLLHGLLNFYSEDYQTPNIANWLKVRRYLAQKLRWVKTGHLRDPARMLVDLRIQWHELDPTDAPELEHQMKKLEALALKLSNWIQLNGAEFGKVPWKILTKDLQGMIRNWGHYDVDASVYLDHLDRMDSIVAALLESLHHAPARILDQWVLWSQVRHLFKDPSLILATMNAQYAESPKIRTLVENLLALIDQVESPNASTQDWMSNPFWDQLEFWLVENQDRWGRIPWAVLPEQTRWRMSRAVMEGDPGAIQLKLRIDKIFLGVRYSLWWQSPPREVLDWGFLDSPDSSDTESEPLKRKILQAA